MAHRYIDTGVFLQTSVAIHRQQCLLVKLPAVIATQTKQRKSAQHSSQITRTTQETLANEADCIHPKNTSIVI